MHKLHSQLLEYLYHELKYKDFQLNLNLIIIKIKQILLIINYGLIGCILIQPIIAVFLTYGSMSFKASYNAGIMYSMAA